METQALPKMKLVSTALLVAGTCIGAGMLALPLVTGHAGFWPAMAVNLLSWFFMLATGLLFLEATLWMPDGSNVLSMAYRFFGNSGRIVCGAAFLFLYSCLMVAYLAAGAPLFSAFLEKTFSLSLSHAPATLLYAALFAAIVYLGTAMIDRVNAILMGGLILTYFLMLGAGTSHVHSTLLGRQTWALSLFALPTLFSAYGYHNIIPSLVPYVNRNEKVLRIGIFIGTLLPLLSYALWQWLVIGSIPEDRLIAAAAEGAPVSSLFIDQESPWVGRFALFFSFFAIVTSLLGVSMSMVDFLGDGLKIKERTGFKRLLLTLPVYAVPALFALQNPHIFLDAVAFAGGFGEAILNGLFPILLVWKGRYLLNLPSEYRLPGGKASLIGLLAITFLVIGLELHHLFG